LASGEPDRARAELEGALRDEIAGPAAAAWLLVSSDARASWPAAIERLLRDAHGVGRLALMRTLGGHLLDSGQAPDRVTEVVRDALELVAEDRWALLASLRLAGTD